MSTVLTYAAVIGGACLVFAAPALLMRMLNDDIAAANNWVKTWRIRRAEYRRFRRVLADAPDREAVWRRIEGAEVDDDEATDFGTHEDSFGRSEGPDAGEGGAAVKEGYLRVAAIREKEHLEMTRAKADGVTVRKLPIEGDKLRDTIRLDAETVARHGRFGPAS